MSLIVVGLSHKTAPVELRERLAISPEKLGAVFERLQSFKDLKEAVILSTCNRLEIYARPQNDSILAVRTLQAFFQELYDTVPLGEFLYQFMAYEAVRHLFRVAAGLDSLVVGESEVLGQVKSAYVTAQSRGATGKITNVLFQRALFVGKQVRTQTQISKGASSVGSIAVRLAERIFGSLQHHRILLLGAGKMAEVTAHHLLSQKAGHIVVLNRTVSKAESLAKILNGTAGSLDELENELLKADIVLCSLATDRPLITVNMMAPIIKARRGRSIYFIDIAVPRNVEAGVHDFDNAYVYNVDDLQEIVEENMGRRKKDIIEAEKLVHGLSGEFHEWVEAALKGQMKPLSHGHPRTS